MPVYLDHNATTPVLPEVLAAMRPHFESSFGNPASVHAVGRTARAAVERARGEVNALLGGPSGDLVFTGSGTEAVLLAVAGGARARSPRDGRVAIAAVEHASGIAAAGALARDGWEVTWIPPDREGRVTPERVAEALREDPVLVSVLHANNETGVIQDAAAIAGLCRERGALFHLDAVQSLGKIPVEAERWGIDFVSAAAHKLGGPPGVGALWKRRGVSVLPVVPGSQEGGLRGGTHNLPAIVGFGRAAVEAAGTMAARATRLVLLRRRLEEAILARIPEVALTGGGAERLPNTAHFTFEPSVGPDLVLALDLEGFAVSAGSACASGSEAPSHVLLAMGMAPERARTAVRVSLGPGNSEDEIDRLVETLARIVAGRGARIEARA